jgi:hypothetical protein
VTSILRVQEIFEQYGIEYLYHMTYISNISSILSLGLLSHKQAHYYKLIKQDISDVDVQNIRHTKKVRGMSLHNYVPLYFNPKNPMLYRRKNLQNNIVLLGVDPLVLVDSRNVFSDGNASCSQTKFYWDLKMLSRLNWYIIRQSTWHDQPDGKRIKCAEVLVYPNVPVTKINKIFCYSEQVAKQIYTWLGDNLSIQVEVNKNLYF